MKIIFRPICWFLTLWETFLHPGIAASLPGEFVWFSGHEWYEMPSRRPVGTGELQCERCGQIDRVKRK